MSKKLFSYAVVEYCLRDEEGLITANFVNENEALKWIKEKIKNNEINYYCIMSKSLKTNDDSIAYWSWEVFKQEEIF